MTIKFISLFLFAISFGANASAANDPKCTYNEWQGELVRHYEAHDPDNSRGWAPLSATICKDSKGDRYVIVGYKGIGLGHIRDLPLKALEPGAEPKEGEKYSAFIVPDSSSVGDEYAYEILKNKNIESAILFTTSRTQVVVFHRQTTGQLFANTLFLKESN